MPGAEHRAGQVRPVGLPNFQQFEPGGTARPGVGSGERRGRGQQGSEVIHPLARELVKLMEQARQHVLDFHPQWWMFGKVLEVANDYSPYWRRRVQSEEFQRFVQRQGNKLEDININLRPELSDQELEERQQFFTDIQTAYGIAAYGQFDPPHKQFFREELRQDIRNLNIGNVTLTEQQRVVLQQIAAATNTPIDPEQKTYHYYTVLQQPDVTEADVEGWYMRAD